MCGVVWCKSTENLANSNTILVFSIISKSSLSSNTLAFFKGLILDKYKISLLNQHEVLHVNHFPEKWM